MKLGLFAVNYGTCGDPASSVRVAQAAEAAGFESVWTGEHIVLPDPAAPSFPLAPRTPFLDTVGRTGAPSLPLTTLQRILARSKVRRLQS